MILSIEAADGKRKEQNDSKTKSKRIIACKITAEQRTSEKG